jgi:hypothetical protein
MRTYTLRDGRRINGLVDHLKDVLGVDIGEPHDYRIILPYNAEVLEWLNVDAGTIRWVSGDAPADYNCGVDEGEPLVLFYDTATHMTRMVKNSTTAYPDPGTIRSDMGLKDVVPRWPDAFLSDDQTPVPADGEWRTPHGDLPAYREMLAAMGATWANGESLTDTQLQYGHLRITRKDGKLTVNYFYNDIQALKSDLPLFDEIKLRRLPGNIEELKAALRDGRTFYFKTENSSFPYMHLTYNPSTENYLYADTSTDYLKPYTHMAIISGLFGWITQHNYTTNCRGVDVLLNLTETTPHTITVESSAWYKNRDNFPLLCQTLHDLSGCLTVQIVRGYDAEQDCFHCILPDGTVFYVNDAAPVDPSSYRLRTA